MSKTTIEYNTNVIADQAGTTQIVMETQGKNMVSDVIVSSTGELPNYDNANIGDALCTVQGEGDTKSLGWVAIHGVPDYSDVPEGAFLYFNGEAPDWSDMEAVVWREFSPYITLANASNGSVELTPADMIAKIPRYDRRILVCVDDGYGMRYAAAGFIDDGNAREVVFNCVIPTATGLEHHSWRGAGQTWTHTVETAALTWTTQN